MAAQVTQQQWIRHRNRAQTQASLRMAGRGGTKRSNQDRDSRASQRRFTARSTSACGVLQVDVPSHTYVTENWFGGLTQIVVTNASAPRLESVVQYHHTMKR